MPDRLEGKLQGLKVAQKEALERTFRRRVPPTVVATAELLRHMLDVSHDIGRRLGVLVDRRGHIEAVCVGDARHVFLPEIGRLRASADRLRGVRWIVTSMHHADPIHRDDLVDLQKLRLDYLLQVARSPNGNFALRGAHLLPGSTEGTRQETGTMPEELSHEDFFEFVVDLESAIGAITPKGRVRKDPKSIRAVLVVVGTGKKSELMTRAAEMKELCDTAGVVVTDTVLQTRSALDPKHVIGGGKLEDVVLNALHLDADTLIFDRELNAAQGRSIADATELKVVDRTQLILDIFAQHATTVDGKLQVELAQLKYNLPRLSEMSTAMSRLSGGIGGRGPGETKLEINRRRAKDRINHLEDELQKASKERELRRKRRRKVGVPVVSIVGYTNAGKSTVLNALTRSHVLVEDKLFATLDTTSRRLSFESQRDAIITDTVGFIRELPEELKKAFAATLEELYDADMLLHVVDASDPERVQKLASVEAILVEMDLHRKPTLVVFNKADLLEPWPNAALKRQGCIVVSAKNHEGLGELLAAVETRLFRAVDAASTARAELDA